MIRRTIGGPLPPLKLTYYELKELIHDLLKDTYDTFDFLPFVKKVAEHVKTNGLGFDFDPHTSYSGGLAQIDEARVREILWDFIINRYLTPGGNGHDIWPTLTITDRGKDYFSK